MKRGSELRAVSVADGPYLHSSSGSMHVCDRRGGTHIVTMYWMYIVLVDDRAENDEVKRKQNILYIKKVTQSKEFPVVWR
jgi:hypothetical protein